MSKKFHCRQLHYIPWIRCFLSAAIVAGLGIAKATDAQTLDEYKAAVEAAKDDKGCLSIPKADLRDRCQRASGFVEQDCKRSQFGCSDLLENKKLSEAIPQIEREIYEMKEERDKSTDDSRKAELKEKIERRSKALEETKKVVATDRGDAAIRAEQGGRCLEARNDVQYLFTSARSSAQSENDNEKSVLAKILIEYWDIGTKRHEDAIRGTKDAIDYCKKCKDGDL